MRISHLDGLRGVAILLVFFYHAFSRWGDIMPYGSSLAWFPLFQYGKYGVQLFFLLSGFVIYMTLDRSKSIPSFLYKRWLRLFPAMFFCSLIIYFTAPLFYERPAGIPNWVDLLPGITLIEPHYLAMFTGLNFNPMEGAFWSIYAEVKFYLFAAFVYFFVSKKHLPWFILGAFIFWWLVVKAPVVSDFAWLEPLRWRLHFTSLEYFGWFACGCFCYQFKTHDDVHKLLLAAGVGITCIGVAGNGDIPLMIALVCIVALFMLSLTWPSLQTILANRLLLFIGFVSYPLYLMHENMMVSSVVQLTSLLPFVPSVIWPLIILALLSGAAYFIAVVIEPNLRLVLKVTRPATHSGNRDG